MFVRIKQPASALAGKNIILTGKGVARVAGSGGELFDRCPYEVADRQGVLPSVINGASPDYVDVMVGGPEAGRDEVQTLTPSAPPASGDIQLTFDGQQTAAIAYNATAGQIKAALEALSNVGVDDVAVSGTLATVVSITFQGALGKKNVPALTVSANTLNGGITVAVATSVKGAAPVTLLPELDLNGVYQLVSSPTEVTEGGNTLVKLQKVEFVRNAGV